MTFVSSESIQIYDFYVNHVLYPSFCCCTRKDKAFYTVSCIFLVLTYCHKLPYAFFKFYEIRI